MRWTKEIFITTFVFFFGALNNLHSSKRDEMNQSRMSGQKIFFSWIVSISFSLVTTQGLAQHLSVLRSTLGSGGSSSYVTLQENSYLIQQSVGQGSVTGTVQPSQIQFRQGFIQPHGNTSKADRVSLAATIFPNPFSTQLVIQLGERNPGQLRIILSDMMGRVVYTSRLDEQQTIFLEPETLPSGYYTIRIYSGKKIFAAKLIKE